MILIFATVENKEKAKEVSRSLLEKRLIACANLFPIESSYWWEGKIAQSEEILMILKAPDKNQLKIEEFINQNSGYDTPEIVSVQADKVNQKYLDWLNKETQS